MDYDFLVIGGGAAGFFGALACAQASAGLRVGILEKGNSVLSKVLVSGGGRCNLTHACFDPARLIQFYPRGGRELRGAFSRFQPRDTAAWFESRGVDLKTEPDGRMFPASDRSQTVIDCFLREGAKAGVQIRKNACVVAIQAIREGYTVTLRGGEDLSTRSILLTSGGDRGGYDLARNIGHTVTPLAPSLFTFIVQDPRLEGLSGVAVVDAVARLPGVRLEQRGPLLVTHWGLSGPVVLRLSAWGARELFSTGYQADLEINWVAGQPIDAVREHLGRYKAANGRKQVAGHPALPTIPSRLWRSLSAAAGIADELVWADLNREQTSCLTAELAAGRYRIAGKGQFKEEFVTCGGVALREVDFRRMESKLLPRFYLAGEVLDIDGITGGFNFQAAWTTGWIAGQSAAENLSGDSSGNLAGNLSGS